MAVASEAQQKTLEYYMGLPYTVEIKHDEDGWFARVPDLPGLMTYAETFEELEPLIEDAKRGYFEVSLEHGDPIPEPRSLEAYSGKVNLRMPRTLHRDLALLAEIEGVSLKQVMLDALARAVGASGRAPRRGSGTGIVVVDTMLEDLPEDDRVLDLPRELRRDRLQTLQDVIQRLEKQEPEASDQVRELLQKALEDLRRASGRLEVSEEQARHER
jgi:antitoxin HicB